MPINITLNLFVFKHVPKMTRAALLVSLPFHITLGLVPLEAWVFSTRMPSRTFEWADRLPGLALPHFLLPFSSLALPYHPQPIPLQAYYSQQPTLMPSRIF